MKRKRSVETNPPPTVTANPPISKKQKGRQQLDKAFGSLQALRDSKDMDLITEAIFEIITAYGLKTDEVAALCYCITEQTIKAEHNAALFERELDLDVEGLSIEGILCVQQALVTK
ncbi:MULTISPECIES: hypothetical protein [Enterococcus]|uniref:hypothetical protein n=1 Tax=Enterococcus TaxID=1350 RepID=UPI000B717CFB|nr:MULTISPECIES: hypothetical protein [Enterococcus]OTO11505.1 hypothetical protein A5875_004650 [Enterococcus sp. 3H8_DIV0648]